MSKYDDIINKGRPESSRPKMSMEDRAKIFAPFAALKGHNEAINETAAKTNYDQDIEHLAFQDYLNP